MTLENYRKVAVIVQFLPYWIDNVRTMTMKN